MERYSQIRDISRMASYANITARLVYLHVACRCDISTYDYHHSLRYLATEIGCSLQQVRTAIRMLEEDGLVKITVATRQTTQALTHLSTQQTTCLHVVKINEIDTATDTATNTAANTAINTAASTEFKNLKYKKNLPTHDADARARMKRTLAQILSLDEDQAAAAVAAFIQRQDIKHKTWESEGDMMAHLIAWTEKRTGTPSGRFRQPPISDHGARIEERRRTEEEMRNRDEAERRRDEVARLQRWIREAEAKGREDLSKAFRDELIKLQKRQ